MNEDSTVTEQQPAAGQQAMSKYGPWVLAGLLALALGNVWFSMRNTIEGKDALLAQKNALLAQKDAEIAGLRTSSAKTVEEANARLKDLAQEADSRLQALAAEATEKLHAANLPEVPVQASFRKALMHGGNVMMLRNTSGQTVPISVEVSRAGAGQRTFELTLDAGQGREIGEREGWAFVSGDLVRVSRPQFKSVMFRAP